MGKFWLFFAIPPICSRLAFLHKRLQHITVNWTCSLVPPDWYSRTNTLGSHLPTSEGWTPELTVGLLVESCPDQTRTQDLPSWDRRLLNTPKHLRDHFIKWYKFCQKSNEWEILTEEGQETFRNKIQAGAGNKTPKRRSPSCHWSYYFKNNQRRAKRWNRGQEAPSTAPISDNF